MSFRQREKCLCEYGWAGLMFGCVWIKKYKKVSALYCKQQPAKVTMFLHCSPRGDLCWYKHHSSGLYGKCSCCRLSTFRTCLIQRVFLENNHKFCRLLLVRQIRLGFRLSCTAIQCNLCSLVVRAGECGRWSCMAVVQGHKAHLTMIGMSSCPNKPLLCLQPWPPDRWAPVGLLSEDSGLTG